MYDLLFPEAGTERNCIKSGSGTCGIRSRIRACVSLSDGEKQDAGAEQEISETERAVKKDQERSAEINRITSCLYEDNISGKILDERYIRMSGEFEAKQKTLEEKLAQNEVRLSELKQSSVDLRMLLKTLGECTEITELNRELVNLLIRRIEIHNNDKYDGHCHVKADIYFTGVVIIDISTEVEMLSLMEEIREKTVTISS